MRGLGNSAAFWILDVTTLAILFFLPTLIGLARGVDGLALVFLVNLIGAPVIIGWPGALILAFGLPRRPRVATARQLRRARGPARGRAPWDPYGQLPWTR